jgi:PAS domain S-box-containing protein
MRKMIASTESEQKKPPENRQAGSGAGMNWLSAGEHRRNENRQYWLWATTIVITLLLTLAAASLAFTVLHSQGEVFYFLDTRQMVSALLGLVLLFDLYIIYQQLQNRRVTRLLHEQHEIFRVIGENAADMIAVVDVNGRRLYNSPSYEHVLGYSPEELASTESLDQIHPDDRQLVKEAVKEARKAGKGKSLEYRFRHKNGSWRILESTASVVRNATGDADKLVIINRDITGRRLAEEENRENQFRQACKMEAVGRLSGGIAHDFNNLLGVILGYIEVLEEPGSTGERLRKGIREIKKASQKAATLTRQLLAFSRQQVLAPKVLDLNAVVADVEAMLQRLIGEDVEMVTVLDEHLGRVLADQGQIEQAIMNLAANARDAMPNGGKLTIRTANVEMGEADPVRSPEIPPGRFIQLMVSDLGIGMDAETQAHVFEPFFTTKGVGKGTGLGLSSVYGIVKQSNGFIRVRSELGKGTTFEIYLPQADGPVPPPEAAHTPGEASHKGKTILLVEDEESLRAVTRDLLQKGEYTVLEAENGARALEVAHQDGLHIDLLLTDVIMPGMTGPALAEELVNSYPEMKILYMSGYTGHVIAQHGLESGAHLLDKPFGRDKLMSKIRDVLEAPTRGLPNRMPKSRRSQRMSLQVRIRVERESDGGMPLCEETTTLSVNVHGALIRLQAKPQLHEKLKLQSAATKEAQDAEVVYISDANDGYFRVGVEFAKPHPSFWHVTFPPEDWMPGHPDDNADEDWDSVETHDANHVTTPG